MTSPTQPAAPTQDFLPPVPPKTARRILISLVFPTVMMPIMQSSINVALPILRDEFLLPADFASWISIIFSLPFMIMASVYGRLSDGTGKRRLILGGSALFILGSVCIVFSPNLTWLLAGRFIQGIGTAGIMPLAMAYISEIFDPYTRGRALGMWSTTGPATAGVGPFMAGFLIESWGWRTALAPSIFLGLLAFAVVYRGVPPGLSTIRKDFLKHFDWLGIGLMAGCFTFLLFFLSSRPITGLDPLNDLRLLAVSLVFGILFVIWENRRQEPFIDFNIFRYRTFNLATLSAGLRLTILSGTFFLLPLYLSDVRGLTPAYIGLVTTISPASMALMVFAGGQLSDRWGSRWPATIGLSIMCLNGVVFYLLPGDIPLAVMVLFLAIHGAGAGFSLASLHRASLVSIPEAQLGAAAGLYGMLRFVGGIIGSAMAGVILQGFLNQSLPVLEAYQNTFLVFAGVGLLGAATGFTFREPGRGLPGEKGQ
jgi:EmrB/QacA subfamily drug resistance transporter